MTRRNLKPAVLIAFFSVLTIIALPIVSSCLEFYRPDWLSVGTIRWTLSLIGSLLAFVVLAIFMNINEIVKEKEKAKKEKLEREKLDMGAEFMARYFDRIEKEKNPQK